MSGVVMAFPLFCLRSIDLFTASMCPWGMLNGLIPVTDTLFTGWSDRIDLTLIILQVKSISMPPVCVWKLKSDKLWPGAVSGSC